MSDKPHLSASQLEMFAKCPESWRRRYLEKEIIPPKLAMLKGTAVHAGAEKNMRQKIETHQDLPANEIIDAAVESFESNIKHDGFQLGPDEKKKDVDGYRNLVVEMATQHAAQQAPEYQPVAVEKKFRIELPDLNHDVVGVIDLVDTNGDVIDFKTAGRAMQQSDADSSTQLSLYAAAQGDVDEVNVKLDILIEPTARQPVRRQLVQAKRDRSDLPVIGRRISVISKTIDAGLFPPAAVGSWWCSESWCGYWSTCGYVNSERIAASRKVEEAMKILEKGIE